MILENIIVGPNQTNCYILGCPYTKEALIIDPGSEAGRIKKAIVKLGIAPKYIINTHGHADHIGANSEFKLPILIHNLDSDFLKNPRKNMSIFFGFLITSPPASKLLEGGEKINIGKLMLEIIHTPGHTPGSISIIVNVDKRAGASPAPAIIFTGDTLFKDGVGRTDLPGSSEKDLFNSIKSKLLVLDDETAIYPGHGPASTIGEERRNNPYLV